jgi:hypothetical protein
VHRDGQPGDAIQKISGEEHVDVGEPVEDDLRDEHAGLPFVRLPTNEASLRPMSQHARGTFTLKMTHQPPYDSVGGVALGRMSIAKQFDGDIEGTSSVEMLSAGTPVKGSAGYVGIERITARVAGRAGSFVLQHTGTMTRGQPELSIRVVPDSGTGELAGLEGRMTIDIVDGQHFYDLEFSIPRNA